MTQERQANRIYRYAVQLCATLLLYSTLCAQQAKEDFLYWNSRRQLRFSDFRIRNVAGDTIYIYRGARANLHRLGTISTAIDVHVKKERQRTTYTIRAVMDRRASWIQAAGDSVTLRHEQGHFDITEIYTRIMRRELRKARSHKDAAAIYEKVLAAESAAHASYDADNTFENGGTTREWRSQIDTQLKALARFSNPVLVLPFDK